MRRPYTILAMSSKTIKLLKITSDGFGVQKCSLLLRQFHHISCWVIHSNASSLPYLPGLP